MRSRKKKRLIPCFQISKRSRKATSLRTPKKAAAVDHDDTD